jgi:hypothetical protein
MKDKDFLFHLIKNLHVSEKGYFTRYAFKDRQAASDKLQLKLFNWLSKQETYDEKALKRLFFKDNPDQLRIHKHHLYNRIVAALNEYSKDEWVESFVWKKVASAKTLIAKGLYESAEKHTKSAYEEAVLAERYDLAYTALHTGRETKGSININKEIYLHYKEHEMQQLDCLRKLDNLVAYRNLLDYFKLMESRLSSIEYFNNDYTKEVQQVYTSPYLKDESMALSFEARCMFYLCKSYIYTSIEKNAQLRNENALNLVRHIESQPAKMKYYASKYRTAINQYLNTCLPLKNFTDFDAYLEKLVNSGKQLNPHLSARNFLMVENLRMNKNFAMEQAKENIAVIHHFEAELKQHEEQLPAGSFHALYTNAAITFFHEELYKDAIAYVNKILNELDEQHNKGVIAIAKTINMIAHYEQGHEELLTYLLKSYSTDEKKSGESVSIVSFVAAVLQWLQLQTIKRPSAPLHLVRQWKELQADKLQYRLAGDAYIQRWLSKRIELEEN